MLLIPILYNEDDLAYVRRHSAPKALVPICGVPLVVRVFQSHNLGAFSKVCVAYSEEYNQWRLQDRLRAAIPGIELEFIEVPARTNQELGLIYSISRIHPQYSALPILVVRYDTAFKIDASLVWKRTELVLTFSDVVVAVGFVSVAALVSRPPGIDSDGFLRVDSSASKLQLESSQVDPLHTPIQIYSHGAHRPLRFCFDLDNTLVTFPLVHGDYRTVSPITANIEFLRFLKSSGHTIIIHTARRMRTHLGNIGAVVKDIGRITLETLEQLQIPYDEIHFGKPHADFYVDDCALSAYANLWTQTGFLSGAIEPRSFNTLNSEADTYTKHGCDLSGEIQFYLALQGRVAWLPELLDYDSSGKWYTMQRIHGVTGSRLYVSEILSVDQLRLVMDTIVATQAMEVKDDVESIHLYSNYAAKVADRYKQHDYSQYDQCCGEMFGQLISELEKYEHSDRGRRVVCHGDTVLTNVLFSGACGIYLIDPRGKMGSVLTVYGDWLYDWAKLYQSLCGYDGILLDVRVSESYEVRMRKAFEDYFSLLYPGSLNTLKMITQSLIFSLIPLHTDSSKRRRYYRLVQTRSSDDQYERI
jgi:capsule biosynthesis phosphatase